MPKKYFRVSRSEIVRYRCKTLNSSNANNVTPSDEDIINIYNQYDASTKRRGPKDNRVHFKKSQSVTEDKVIELPKP